jgi:hypothetical protein
MLHIYRNTEQYCCAFVVCRISTVFIIVDNKHCTFMNSKNCDVYCLVITRFIYPINAYQLFKKSNRSTWIFLLFILQSSHTNLAMTVSNTEITVFLLFITAVHFFIIFATGTTVPHAGFLIGIRVVL